MFLASRLARLTETSTFRHAALSAFIFLLMAFGSAMLSSRLIERLLLDHVRDMILGDIQLQQASSGTALQLARRQQQYMASEDRLIQIVAADGRMLHGQARLQGLLAGQTGWLDLETTGADGLPLRVFGLQMRLADGGHYFSGFNLQPMLERVRVIPVMAGAGLFALLLTSLIVGLCSSLRSMRRVDRIRQGLRAYAGGKRDARIATRMGGDEYDLLGMDINHLLERINLLMDEVGSVSSHLAHELRTPLTRMHNLLAEASEGSCERVREKVGAAQNESAHVLRLIRAVLRIGEIEAGRGQHEFEWFDTGQLLQDLAEYYAPLADEAGIAITQSAPAQSRLYGDRALLFQALANLLENAFKYAPNGAIGLHAGLHQGKLRIGVADHGPGIAPERQAQAMKRFGRLHGQEKSGHGLGLALVSAIARLHAGQLVLENRQQGGLDAALQLPAAHWGAPAAALKETPCA